MRNVVLYIGMSLDGFIAKPKGEVDWLGGDGKKPEEDNGYRDFIQGIDTVLMGSTTYHQVITELSPNVWPYEGLDTYVFSRSDQVSPYATFIKADIRRFLLDLKSKEGKDIWICGGASIVNQLIKENLIDTYYITVMPIILGEGIPLFSVGNPEILLQHEKTINTNGMVNIIYNKREKWNKKAPRGFPLGAF